MIAVILSQIPPIKDLIKKANLDLEAHSKISITHKIGNPNLQMHVIITNIGGRTVRVKDISVSLSRDGKHLVSLPAQNYLQNQNDKDTLLFTTFSLSPGKEWAHITNFLNYFGRVEEKEYYRIEGKMIVDYRAQKKGSEGTEKNSLIEHPVELVSQALDFFNSKFIWQEGEYVVKVEVETVNDIANTSKEYRFTIFESHTEQLKEITEEYKFGGGIWWDSKTAKSSIILPISEA